MRGESQSSENKTKERKKAAPGMQIATEHHFPPELPESRSKKDAFTSSSSKTTETAACPEERGFSLILAARESIRQSLCQESWDASRFRSTAGFLRKDSDLSRVHRCCAVTVQITQCPAGEAVLPPLTGSDANGLKCPCPGWKPAAGCSTMHFWGARGAAGTWA